MLNINKTTLTERERITKTFFSFPFPADASKKKHTQQRQRQKKFFVCVCRNFSLSDAQFSILMRGLPYLPKARFTNHSDVIGHQVLGNNWKLGVDRGFRVAYSYVEVNWYLYSIRVTRSRDIFVPGPHSVCDLSLCCAYCLLLASGRCGASGGGLKHALTPVHHMGRELPLGKFLRCFPRRFVVALFRGSFRVFRFFAFSLRRFFVPSLFRFSLLWRCLSGKKFSNPHTRGKNFASLLSSPTRFFTLQANNSTSFTQESKGIT